MTGIVWVVVGVALVNVFGLVCALLIVKLLTATNTDRMSIDGSWSKHGHVHVDVDRSARVLPRCRKQKRARKGSPGTTGLQEQSGDPTPPASK